MTDEDKELNKKFKKKTEEKKKQNAETSAYQPATDDTEKTEETTEEPETTKEPENDNPNSPEKLKDDGGSFENGEAGKDNTPKNK